MDVREIYVGMASFSGKEGGNADCYML